MIRPAREDEIEALASRITSIDPWLKLGITATSLVHGIRTDHKRTVNIFEANGAILGVIITRSDAAEMMYITGWAPQLVEHYGKYGPLHWRNLPPAAYVGSLAVFPEAQGMGVGSILLNYSERCARHAGLDRIYLMVTDRNTRAKEFYSRRNYTPVGYLDNCIQPGNREWLLEKHLT